MVFKKRAVNIPDNQNIRYIHYAKSKGNSFVINELIINRDVKYELKVFKDDELLYEANNIPTLQKAEIEVERYAKSLKGELKSQSDSISTIKAKNYQSKLNSLKIKMNALIKKYPDERGIQEIKDYFETIL